MGAQVICDKCGVVGAHDYKVNVSGLGVVVAGNVSASEHAMELCDACRDEGVKALFDKAYNDLINAIPMHKELIAVAKEVDELQDQLRQAVMAREEHAEGSSFTGDDGKRYVSPKDAEENKRLDAIVAGIQRNIEAKQARRNEILKGTV